MKIKMKMKKTILFLAIFLGLFALIGSVNADVGYVTRQNPTSGSWANQTNANILFQYNFTSNSSATANCSLWIQQANETSFYRFANVTDAANLIGYLNLTANVSDIIRDGNVTWKIGCADNVNSTNSSVGYLYVLRSFYVVITSPGSEVWTEDTTPTVNITNTVTFANVTALQGSLFRNCTFYIDGANVSHNESPTIVNGTTWNMTSLIAQSDGNHTLRINCTTWSDVQNQSAVLYYGTDLTACSIASLEPSNWLIIKALPDDGSKAFITFNWTATDNVYPVVTCNLTIDGRDNWNTSVTSTSGTKYSSTHLMTYAQHLWKVRCSDNTGNTCENLSYTVILETTLLGEEYGDCPGFREYNPESGECCLENEYYDGYTCRTKPIVTTTTVKPVIPSLGALGALLPTLGEIKFDLGLISIVIFFIALVCIGYWLIDKEKI